MKNKYYGGIVAMFLLLLTASFTQAQSVVSGTIYDTETGEALIGANVVIQGTTIGSSTDINGNFEINNSRAFPWTLQVSYTGYIEKKISVAEATSGLRISLDVSNLFNEEVVISASRAPEKVQEAPASISVIGAKELNASANPADATRNLINTPGVQIQQQSANRINISMRGGSGLFGTGVFPILDYRSLVGPGIGTFESDRAGINNVDLQRIEVVRGPGSALYGPGVTQGVVHFISKNPIDFPGTTLEVFGGELETFGGTVRHAGRNSNETFGYKVNASYKQGGEFTLDPNDADDAIQIAKFIPNGGVFQPAVNGGIVDVTQAPTQLLSFDELDDDGDGNPMQDDWYNFSVNATLEFRPSEDLTVFTSGGYNEASGIFYNEQGEGLAQATEKWAQARAQYKGLFAQMFYVTNDGGSQDRPTFLYQTGNRTPVARRQIEAQLQYNFQTPSLLDANWTAGFDYRLARQDTENLVYGRNEDDDSYEVIGGYVQGKFALGEKVDMVLAGRYDQFNFIDDGAFAPRAAFVFKVNPRHTLRTSYNRSNSTVSNLQLNIDFPLATIIPGAFDIWLYGNKTEQTFDGQTIQWFNENIPDGLTSLPLGVPFGAVAAQTLAGLQAGLGPAIGADAAAVVANAIGTQVNPATLGLTGSLSPGFNLFDGSPLVPTDAPISKISTHDSFEVGYKGLVASKLGVTFDVYYITEKNNSQFTAISPAYFLLGQADISVDLGNAVTRDSESPIVADLTAFFQTPAGGSMDPATAAANAQGTYNAIAPSINGAFQLGGDGFEAAIAPLPFHATTSTNEVPTTGGTHIAAGYRTFDERSYAGSDLGLEYYFNESITFYGNYSWVSDIEFMQKVVGFEDGPSLPSYLNIPKNKFRLGVSYLPEAGLNANIAFQHDDSYFASAGQFSGDTSERNLVDLSVGYALKNGLNINVSATNAFNNEYRYLPNMPKIGRRILGKITYTFGDKD